MDIRLKAKIARRVHGQASFRHGRTTAGVTEAPSDGLAYVRRYSEWVAIESGVSETRMIASALLSCVGGAISNATLSPGQSGSVTWVGA